MLYCFKNVFHLSDLGIFLSTYTLLIAIVFVRYFGIYWQYLYIFSIWPIQTLRKNASVYLAMVINSRIGIISKVHTGFKIPKSGCSYFNLACNRYINNKNNNLQGTLSSTGSRPSPRDDKTTLLWRPWCRTTPTWPRFCRCKACQVCRSTKTRRSLPQRCSPCLAVSPWRTPCELALSPWAVCIPCRTSSTVV